MAGPASSRTVSASTDSSVSTAPPEGGPRTAVSRAMASFVALWAAASERVSHFWTTPHWRRAKTTADRVVLVVFVGAFTWAVVNAVFVAQRAATNRTLAIVHLSSQPTVQIKLPGSETESQATLPTEVLHGTQTERIEIFIANDGPDGVVLKNSTLTGPYLGGAVKLAPKAGGYIDPTGGNYLTGTVTVDCDAAARTANALVAGRPSPLDQPTTVAVAVADADGTVHHMNLVIDTTAFAVQGQVCTS
jgi:hypothetical protein